MAATSCISSIRAPAPVRLATRRSGKSSMSLIVHDGIARGEFEWDAGTRPWKVWKLPRAHAGRRHCDHARGICFEPIDDCLCNHECRAPLLEVQPLNFRLNHQSFIPACYRTPRCLSCHASEKAAWSRNAGSCLVSTLYDPAAYNSIIFYHVCWRSRLSGNPRRLMMTGWRQTPLFTFSLFLDGRYHRALLSKHTATPLFLVWRLVYEDIPLSTFPILMSSSPVDVNSATKFYCVPNCCCVCRLHREQLGQFSSRAWSWW